MLSVTKIFEFEAAHRLPDYDGKCQNLHGHSYRLEIGVSGDVSQGAAGMVIDFSELKKVVNEYIICKLDHCYLNDIFKNPTAEVMTEWIRDILLRRLLGLCRIRLWETSTSYCEWAA